MVETETISGLFGNQPTTTADRDHNDTGYWQWNPKTDRIHLSKSLCRLFQRPANSHQLNVESFLQYIAPQDRDNLQELMKHCAQEHQVCDTSVQIVLPDESRRHVRLHGDWIHSATDNSPCLQGALTDTFNGRCLEQALKDTQTLFTVTASVAVDAVILTDGNGRIEYWNPAAERIFGFSATEALGNKLHSLITDQAQDEEYKRIIRLHSDTGQDPLTGKTIELRARRKDGAHIPVQISMSSFKLHDKWHTVSFMHDISRRRHNEQKLLKARNKAQKAKAKAEALKHKAEKANQEKSAFLSRMSHELRTPLNSILGFSELLAHDNDISPDNRETLQLVRKAGKHLLELINDVLDLSRIEAGHIDLNMGVISVHETLLECYEQMGPIAQQYDIRLSYHSSSSNCCIIADKTRLKQIIINLLSNAIKYNKKDGWVIVSARQSTAGDTVSIEIEDSGIGFTSEDQEKIFEHFNRNGQEYSLIEGTGIGLGLSRSLVQMMDGEMGISSIKDVGSCFSLHFTNASSQENTATEAPLAQAYTSHEYRHPAKLLYIEDNADNIRLMRAYLKSYPGLSLETANTAREGVLRVKNGHHCAILLDLNLPDMKGEQAIQILKEKQQLPVIAVTASAMPEDQQRCLANGFDGFVSKPVDRIALANALQQICDRHCRKSPRQKIGICQTSTRPDGQCHREVINP